jgi:hypothetical protein
MPPGLATVGFNANQLIAPSPGLGLGVGGSVMHGPIGTPLPNGTDQVLSTSLTDLGYVDENGIKDKEERRNTDTFAWGGGLVGNIQQSYARTMTIRFLQFLNGAVLATAYGAANTTLIPATSFHGNQVQAQLNALLLDTLSWVFQGFYKGALVLKVVPSARVVSVGDVDFTHRAFTTVECTLKAFPDALNNHAYLYTDDGQLSTGGVS